MVKKHKYDGRLQYGIRQSTFLTNEGKSPVVIYPITGQATEDDVLMEKMKGHVWTLTCPENKLGTYRAKYRVTNIAGDGENVVLRVITDGKPTEDAVQAEARLEDFYLSVFGE